MNKENNFRKIGFGKVMAVVIVAMFVGSGMIPVYSAHSTIMPVETNRDSRNNLIPQSESTDGWVIETMDDKPVDPKWGVGFGCVIGTDIADNPHIAYYDFFGVRYALRTKTGWNIENVTNSSTWWHCYYVPMAINSDGDPHLLYFDLRSNIVHAKKSVLEWNFDEVDTTTWGTYSITIDDFDNPHICYAKGEYGLKYAVWTGSKWKKSTVDGNSYTGYENSIAVDSEGIPCISYYGREGLQYAKLNGSKWDREVVGAVDAVSNAIAVDAEHRPHICFLDWGNQIKIKYAYKSGSKWDICVIDTFRESDYFPMYITISLDPWGNPHTCYFDIDESSCTLKYARWTGTSWKIEVITSMENNMPHEQLYPTCSVAVDSKGNPHISYWDAEDLSLKYAKKINEPPSKPAQPSGPTSGKISETYTYSTSASDPEGEPLYYIWDWGDGSYSDPMGPFNSGETCEASHTWEKKGNYNIRVKVKDINDKESEWSDPLPVSMPKCHNILFEKLLEKLFELLNTKIQIYYGSTICGIIRDKSNNSCLQSAESLLL